jgi:nucleotidyltransferase substrate binding protein (TIGR01987 family)
MQDVRWLQRFANYQNALAAVEAAVTLAKERPLSDLEKQGLIQSFEFTHELAWNLLKDYLEEKGFTDIHGSKDVTRAAFREGYIKNCEVWLDMVVSRNKTSHTYDFDTAEEIVKLILHNYVQEFRNLQNTMSDYAAKMK